MKQTHENFKIQTYVTSLAVFLFLVNLIAWYLTNSVAILTNALESIVNVVAAFMALYTIRISSKPKDLDHPYGHGKAELISAAVEGVLIGIAGILIIKEAVLNLYNPHHITHMDAGMVLVLVTGLLNFWAAKVCIRRGQQTGSLAMLAEGKHLMADVYTTIGLLLGLLIIYLTGIWWMDSIVAIIFSVIIMYTGYRIIRSSVAGMMDEADLSLLKEMVTLLNKHRSENWIDLHNLRIIKYGAMLHMDCHLTVPWYMNVHEAHREIDQLTALIKSHYGESVELFVHSDGCLDFSCAICTKIDCPVRKSDFQQKLDWTLDNISSNKKHALS